MILSLTGMVASLYMYHYAPSFAISLTNNVVGRSIYTFLNGKWLFDVVYNKYIIRGGMSIGHTLSKVIDRGAIEMVGPYGLTTVLTGTGKSIAQYDTGVITSYALYIILGLISFIFLLFAPILVNVDPTLNISLAIVYIFTVVLLSKPRSTNSPYVRGY